MTVIAYVFKYQTFSDSDSFYAVDNKGKER